MGQSVWQAPTQSPAGSTPEWGMGKPDDGYHCK